MIADTSSAFVAALCCPQTGQPFVSAQYVNCWQSHACSEQTALALYGKMVGNGLCEREGPCFICNQTVTAYYANPSLQKVVDIYFSHHPRPEKTPHKTVTDGTQKFPFAKATFSVHPKGSTHSKAATGFVLQNSANASKIHLIAITISGVRLPDSFISISLLKATEEESASLLKYYHGNALTKFEIKDNKIENTRPLSLDELTKFFELLKSTNNCDELTTITLNILLQRAQPGVTDE